MGVSEAQAPSSNATAATRNIEEATSTAQEQKDSTESIEKANFSNFWRILSHRTAQDGIALLIGLGCSMGSGVALPLMNIVFGNLVGDFNGYFVPNSTVTESRFKSTVNRNALYIFYLFIGKFVLTYISMFCFRVTGLRISANLRLSYVKSLFAQPIRKLDEVSAGTVANTITSSANTIQLSISDKLHSLFMALALIIAAYAIAFSRSWALTLVTSSALVFIMIVYSISTPIVIKLVQQVEKADAKAASIAGEVFGSIRTALSLGAKETLTGKYDSSALDSYKKGLRLSKQMGIQLAPIFFSIYASFSLAFWFGIRLYSQGHIGNINAVIIVVFSILIVVSVLGVLAAPIIAITKAVGVSAAFFDMIDSEQVSHTGLTEPDVSAHEDITLEDVFFAYPTRSNVQVLKGFNAKFPKGKTTALVGPSGSGKSTIVALLERWYDLQEAESEKTDPVIPPQSAGSKEGSDVSQSPHPSQSSGRGSVSIGGRNINQLELKWWRSQIGLVQQEPFLFNDTILNNVAFGLLGSKWEHDPLNEKRARVQRACREAFADEFIEQLPEGYDTQVGESGIKLSGGQRQRLAIARSIVREPAILILDEATSSIDVRGERIVQQALERVSQDRTTIVIAHRLSTIRKADNIIVMREGRKMEEGTHEYLLTIPDGVYAGLVHAQQLENDSAAEADNTDDVTTLTNLERRETTNSTRKDEANSTGEWKNKSFFQSVGLFLYEQRSHWKLYVCIIISAMGAGSAFSLQAFLFSKTIEVFQFTGERLTDRGNFWALMFLVLALSISVCYFCLGYLSNHLSVNVATFYRREYFRSILSNPIPFFDRQDNASGTLMSRLSSDPKQLQELVGFNGVFPLISIFNMTGCIAIAFSFGWKLTLVTFFAAMPVIFTAAFFRINFDLQFEKWNAEVFAHSSQFATEAIGAFRTVSALTMEHSIVTKYQTLLQEQIKKATRKAAYASLVFALSDSVELCAMALTFWYGGQLLASREYDPVQFFVIYIAIVQGAQGAGQFFSFAPNIAQATAASNRILSLRYEVAEREKTEDIGKPLIESDTKTGAEIELKNVAFKYPTRDNQIYRNLNLTIKSGQFVAFVGPSGCGKTTVISLLERFYDPVSGTILFDGQDTRTIEISSYRQALSLVSQEPRLFDGTIRDNLILGLAPEKASEEAIIQACKDAEIYDFVVSLPDGFDTSLGIHTQTSLSGGQKQRLCLARALLRDPRLLLLDEATSSLDSQSEKLVQAAIERLVGQRRMTVVAVAHRLATIQKADVIFVFGESEVGRGSRILQQGTHHELLRSRGPYWSMCQEQALDR